MSALESTPYAKIHKHNIFEKVYWACRRGFERIVYKFKKSPMQSWAENEVRLACEREREASGTPKGKWDYGCACYESALKALKVLAKEGHSGSSIRFTQDILNRLIEWKPLSPIEDTPDMWNYSYMNKETRETVYQNKRMSGLFKHIYSDGRIVYNDIDRVVCQDIKSGSRYQSGMIRDIIDEMYPITMPYMPHTNKRYMVYCAKLLTDRKNGDYDSICVHHVITPDDKTILINRYFKEGKETDWDEIDAGEWLERVKMDEERAFEDARHSQNNGVTELQNDEISWEHLEEHIIDFVDAAIKLGIDYSNAPDMTGEVKHES